MGDIRVGGAAPGVGDNPPNPQPAQDIVNQMLALWGINGPPGSNDDNWTEVNGMLLAMAPLWTNIPGSAAATAYNQLLNDFKAGKPGATIYADIQGLNSSLPVLTANDIYNCLAVNSQDPPRTCALQVLANSLNLFMSQSADFSQLSSIVQGIATVIDHFATNTSTPLSSNDAYLITNITDQDLSEYLNNVGTTNYPTQIYSDLENLGITITAPPSGLPNSPGVALIDQLEAALRSWTANGTPSYDSGSVYQARVGGILVAMKSFWDMAGDQTGGPKFKTDMDNLFASFQAYVGASPGSNFAQLQAGINQLAQDGDPTQILIDNGNTTNLNIAMQSALKAIQGVLFTQGTAISYGASPQAFGAFLKGMTTVVELFTQTGWYGGSGGCYFSDNQRMAVQQVVDRDIPAFINESGMLDLTQIPNNPVVSGNGGVSGYYFQIQDDITTALTALQG
jgi:hypothetical protein